MHTVYKQRKHIPLIFTKVTKMMNGVSLTHNRGANKS